MGALRRMAGLPSRWAYRLGNPIGTRCMRMRATSTKTARAITTRPITLSISRSGRSCVKPIAIISGRSAVIIINNVSLGGHRTRLNLCSSGMTNGAPPSAWRGRSVHGPKLAGAVDLDKAIGKKTYAFVKKRFDSENGGAGELSLQINKVSNDGT